MNPHSAPLLRVRNLETEFRRDDTITHALRGVSFHVDPGEMLGIVGESGCGKSVLSLSILRLLPRETGRILAGEVTFDGRDFVRLSEPEMRKVRGDRIAMIFQEPMTSLNPVYTVGAQIAEAIRIHTRATRREAWAKAEEMLRLVRIPDPQQRARTYPHQLSGGMRQRVMIAMALSCSPRLLIADEPTTALDVTIQAQILRLILDLKECTQTAVMLITHDLALVAEVCQRVIVMYAGKIVEEANVSTLFRRSAHPYTIGLLRSIPKRGKGRTRLPEIAGVVPNLRVPIVGCSFAPRCVFAKQICREQNPPLRNFDTGHLVACWRAEEVVAA